MCVRMLQGRVFGPCRKATTAVLEGRCAQFMMLLMVVCRKQCSFVHGDQPYDLLMRMLMRKGQAMQNHH